MWQHVHVFWTGRLRENFESKVQQLTSLCKPRICKVTNLFLHEETLRIVHVFQHQRQSGQQCVVRPKRLRQNASPGLDCKCKQFFALWFLTFVGISAVQPQTKLSHTLEWPLDSLAFFSFAMKACIHAMAWTCSETCSVAEALPWFCNQRPNVSIMRVGAHSDLKPQECIEWERCSCTLLTVPPNK